MLFESILLFSTLTLANPLRSSSLVGRGSVPVLNGGQVLMSPGVPSGEYPRSTNKQGDESMIGGFALTTPENDLVLKTVKSIDGGNSWQALGEVVSLSFYPSGIKRACAKCFSSVVPAQLMI